MRLLGLQCAEERMVLAQKRKLFHNIPAKNYHTFVMDDEVLNNFLDPENDGEVQRIRWTFAALRDRFQEYFDN